MQLRKQKSVIQKQMAEKEQARIEALKEFERDR